MIDPGKINIQNKKAGFEFEITDRYEAGIVLRGSEIKVTVAILLNFLYWLVSEFRNICINLSSYKKNFLRLNFNISGLSSGPTKRLVDHDSRIW